MSDTIVNKASIISYQACNMFNKTPTETEGSFTMYSHDRFSSLIIQGIAHKMLEQGSTEEHVKYVLAHKAIRWMLDAEGDMLVEFGKMLADKHRLAEIAMQE